MLYILMYFPFTSHCTRCQHTRKAVSTFCWSRWWIEIFLKIYFFHAKSFFRQTFRAYLEIDTIYSHFLLPNHEQRLRKVPKKWFSCVTNINTRKLINLLEVSKEWKKERVNAIYGSKKIILGSKRWKIVGCGGKWKRRE